MLNKILFKIIDIINGTTICNFYKTIHDNNSDAIRQNQDLFAKIGIWVIIVEECVC